MSERYTLVAFCTLVTAICYLATIAAVLAYFGRYAEALGFGGLTTGLVGVLGTFKPRAASADVPQDVRVTNTPADPAHVQPHQ